MFILLLLIWFIFNGKITWELTVLGMILCACIYFFMCRFMDYSLKKDVSLMRRSVSFLYYTGVLIVEIIKSNLQVMHLTLTDREIVEPVIISYRTRLRSKLGRVILANSITLTPGTITISLEEDELVIHCLDKTIAEGIENSTFEQLLEKMERQ
ncbi:MAG: Na+/H+ antiporter subunit E [Lachnospiraceae bacterium]|nr:Na+/H+ antiporter subunit E [Lachnospiraceae bacterium]